MANEHFILHLFLQSLAPEFMESDDKDVDQSSIPKDMASNYSYGASMHGAFGSSRSQGHQKVWLGKPNLIKSSWVRSY